MGCMHAWWMYQYQCQPVTSLPLYQNLYLDLLWSPSFPQLQVERSLQRQQQQAASSSQSSSSTGAGSSSSSRGGSRNGSSSSGGGGGGGVSFELTLLEVENDRLREVAEALLRRHQLLEDLAEMHNLIASREGGRLVLILAAASAPGGKLPGSVRAAKRVVKKQQGAPVVVDKLERAMLDSLR